MRVGSVPAGELSAEKGLRAQDYIGPAQGSLSLRLTPTDGGFVLRAVLFEAGRRKLAFTAELSCSALGRLLRGEKPILITWTEEDPV